MEVAKLYVSLLLDADGYNADLDRAANQAKGWAKTTGTRVSNALRAAFLVGIAALGVAVAGAFTQGVNAAIDFESAFTGVIKTVDAATDDLGNLTAVGEELRQGFRDMAKEVPIAVEELAEIGELGGQLGVAHEDLLAFTDTIAKLGVTTNLSTDEAASAFAQIGNVMGSSQDDLTRLASSVVGLGNNFATTERDIVNFMQRIAGAGQIAGLTESDLAAVGAAFSSVGVEAEAGGTAVQKVLLGINTSIVEGSEDVAKFAETAGLSADEFAALWEEDAAEGFTRFVEGLGTAGDDAILVLQDLGLQDQRLIRSFLSLAGAGDLLRDAIELSSNAFSENEALQAEAATRFATTESKIQLLKNTVNDLFITIGNYLLPIVGNVIDALQGFAEKAIEVGIRIGEFIEAVRGGDEPLGALKSLLADLGVPPETIATVERFIGTITTIADKAGEVGQRVLEFAGQFVTAKDLIMGVVTAIAIALGVALAPAVASIVGTIALITGVVAGLTAVFAGVRTAWDRDLGGIRTLILGLVERVQGFIAAFRSAADEAGGIGALFAQKFNELRAGAQPALDAIAGFFGPTFARIREAFAGLGTTVGPLQEKLSELGQAFGRLLEALKPIGALVGVVVAVLAKLLGEVLGTVLGNADKILGGFITAVTGQIDAFASLIGGIVEFVKKLFAGDLQGAFDALGSGVAGFVEGVGTMLSGLLTVIDGIVGSIFDAVVNVISDITGAALPSWEEFKALVVEKFNALKEGVVNAWQSIVEKFNSAKQSVAETKAGFLAFVADVGAKWEAFKAQAVGVWQSITTALSTAWASIKSFSLKETIAGWLTSLSNLAGQGATAVRNFASSAIAGLGSLVSQGVASAQQFVTNVITGISGLAVRGVAAIKSGIQAMINAWRGIDWYQVGYNAMSRILDVVAFIGIEMPRKIAGWTKAIVTWVTDTARSAIEWGKDIATSVLDGLKTFVQEAPKKLAEWALAFLKWYGNLVRDAIEWGKDIATSVLDGLKTFVQEAPKKLAEWALAFLKWYGNLVRDAIEWGKGIATSVIDGLKTFIEEAPKKLAEWATAFVTWATDTAQDAIQWGTDLVTGVLDGLKSFIEEAPKKLAEWATAFTDWVAETAEDAIQWGTDLVTGVLDGLKTFVDDVKATVSDWVTSISTAVEDKAGEILQIGTDIVNGIKDGITNAATSVANAAVDMAQGALDAVREFLGIESPSKEFKALGIFSGEGLAGGFAASVPVVASAAHGMAVSALDGAQSALLEGIGRVIEIAADMGESLNIGLAQQFAESATAVSGVFGPAVEALNAIADYTISDRVLPAIESLREHIAYMVDNFAVAAYLLNEQSNGTALGLAQDMASTTGAVVDVVGGAIEALEGIAAFAVPNIEPQMVAFVGMISLLVSSVANAAAQIDATLLVHAQLFAESTGAVVGMIDGAIDAIASIEAFEPSVVGTINQNAIRFATQITIIVHQLAQASNAMSVEAIEHVGAFADGAGAVVEILDGAIEAIASIKAFEAGSMGALNQAAREFATQITIVVHQLEMASSAMSAEAIEHVGAFAESAGAVIGILDGAIEAIASIKAFEAGSMGALNQAAREFATQITIVVHQLELASSAMSARALGHVRAFSESAGVVVGLVENALGAISLIFDYEQTQGLMLSAQQFTGDLVLLVQILSDTLAKSALATGEALGSASALTDGITAVLGVVSGAIDALGSIAGYVREQGLALVAQQFATDLVMVAQTLSDTLAKSALATGEALGSASALTDGITAVLGVVSGAIDAIGSITGYVRDQGIVLSVQQFATDLVLLVQILSDTLAMSTIATGEALGSAAGLADGIAAVLGVVSGAIDALGSITGYVREQGIVLSVQQFATDLVLLVQILSDTLAKSTIATGEALGSASALTDGITAVLGLVSGAIDALGSITGYVRDQGIVLSVQQFAVDLVLLVQILSDTLAKSTIATGEALGSAAALSTNITAVLGTIGPAVDALGALAEFTIKAGLEGKAQAFTRALVMVAETLVSGLQASEILLAEAVAESAGIATGISTIFGVIAPAIDGFGALAEFTIKAGIESKARAFTRVLTAVAEILVADLTSAASKIGSEALSAAAEFAQAALDISTLVRDALGTMSELAESKRVNVSPALANLVAQAEAIEDALAQAHGALGGTVVQAAHDFQAAVVAIVDALQDAFDTIGSLVGRGGDLQHILDDMIDALRAKTGDGLEAMLAQVKRDAPAVVREIGSMVEAMIEQILAVDWSRIGYEVVAELAQGVARATFLLANEVGAALLSAYLIASSYVSKFTNLGTQMAQGMASGFARGAGSIASAVSRAASAAIAAANRTLGIASPSKVFRAIGQFAIDGLALAFKDARGLAEAVKYGVNTAVGAAQGVGLGVDIPAPVAGNVGALSGSEFAGSTTTITNNYVIESPVPISEEGDLVKNIRLLRLKDA